MTVRFKLDENMPARARERLIQAGWDVHDVHDEGLAGARDSDLQIACDREQRILLTLDLDFADARAHMPAKSPGVIVLRPRDQSIRSVLECLEGAIRTLATEPLAGALWIVEPTRVRIRDGSTGA